MYEEKNEEKNKLAVQKRERFEASIANSANLWGYSSLGLEAKKAAMSMLSTKHGLYANVPIICKEQACPYHESCKLFEYGLAPVGEPCPIEVAQIEMRYLKYNEDFDLENGSFTDTVIVNEIIETDIMMERCKKLIEAEMLPIQETAIGVSAEGDVITAPQVSKTVELSERLSKKRLGLLNMMKATRKDKKEDEGQGESLASLLAMAVKKEENNDFVIDVKPEHIK